MVIYMENDEKCLRILKKGVSLKDIFKDEFINKLNDNFENSEVVPVGVAFVLKNNEITEDMINLTYRNDEDINNEIVLIDVNNNPDNMNAIKKSL